jgi:hypothetical protein
VRSVNSKGISSTEKVKLIRSSSTFGKTQLQTELSNKIENVTPGEFLANYPQNLSEIAGRLRELVRSTIPSATEKVYTGWKLLGYRIPAGKKLRYFCCIVPQKKENDVLLGFQYGIAMQDPKNQMEGKGTQVRFVRVQRLDQYFDSDLTWLIEEAARVAVEMAN